MEWVVCCEIQKGITLVQSLVSYLHNYNKNWLYTVQVFNKKEWFLLEKFDLVT
jgi:hypothetical protein